MPSRISLACLALVATAELSTPLLGNTTSFGLLGDPGQSYTFARSDSPVGQTITEPAGPYPGWLGSNTPNDQYGFFCIDFLKGANWNTSYLGVVAHVQDVIPGKTTEQLVEAAYLSDELYHLGGFSASTSLYKGPISFAIWQIMDPVPGHVPVDPAAQPYILAAKHAYQTGQITAALYPNTLIFIPNNTGIQDFMSLTAAVPEPGTIVLFLVGIGLIGLGRLRIRHKSNPEMNSGAPLEDTVIVRQ